MKAMLIAGAPVAPSLLVDEAVAASELIVAADSGAASALKLGRVPDVVVGDFDSLEPGVRQQLEKLGVPMREYPVRKDKTDLHLALLTAIEWGAREVTLVGILGGERSDHSVAGLLLLARDEFAAQRLRVIDGDAEMFITRDRAALRGRPGEYVSLLSLTPFSRGINGEGLEYPLCEASLSFGDSLGVSNVLVEPEAAVTLREGVLLVIHQHQFGDHATTDRPPSRRLTGILKAEG